MQYIRILFFTHIIFSGLIFCQVNTEKYRTPADTTGINASVEIEGTLETGNTENQQLSVDGIIDYKWRASTVFLVSDISYKWADKNEFSNDGLLHLRYVRKLSENWKSEAFSQINYDKVKLIKLRTLLGAGLRFNLQRSEAGELWFGSAAMWEKEKLKLTDTESNKKETSVLRWSNYLNYKLEIKEGLTFASVVYYQPQFDKFNDYRILNENNLIIDLTRVISFTIEFGLRYDSRPPGDLKELDTTTEVGIVFRI